MTLLEAVTENWFEWNTKGETALHPPGYDNLSSESTLALRRTSSQLNSQCQNALPFIDLCWDSISLFDMRRIASTTRVERPCLLNWKKLQGKKRAGSDMLSDRFVAEREEMVTKKGNHHATSTRSVFVDFDTAIFTSAEYKTADLKSRWPAERARQNNQSREQQYTLKVSSTNLISAQNRDIHVIEPVIKLFVQWTLEITRITFQWRLQLHFVTK